MTAYMYVSKSNNIRLAKHFFLSKKYFIVFRQRILTLEKAPVQTEPNHSNGTVQTEPLQTEPFKRNQNICQNYALLHAEKLKKYVKIRNFD